jgi:hypothetical protein
MEFAEPKFDYTEINAKSHLAKLATAMWPEPKAWAFKGEVYDTKNYGSAQCSCGHPIRWVFIIERDSDGKKLPIGSTCIETSIPYLISHGAEGLAEALQKALEKLQAEIAAAKKAAADALATEQVQEIKADFEALQEWWKIARESWKGYRPEALYKQISLPAAASTPGRTAAGMRKRYVTTYDALLDVQATSKVILPALPKPAEKKLAEKLAKDLESSADKYLAAADKAKTWSSTSWQAKKNYAKAMTRRRAAARIAPPAGEQAA